MKTDYQQISIIGEEEKKGILEAILFASGDPLSTKALAEAVLLSEKETLAVLESLQLDYSDKKRGIRLKHYNELWQLATKQEYAQAVASVLKFSRSSGLSRAAMETLSIIAYKQPVTRLIVEQIRGVSSSSSIQVLMDKNLIEEAGRLDAPGRPFLYKTTALFLKSADITSLNELPDYATFSAMNIEPETEKAFTDSIMED